MAMPSTCTRSRGDGEGRIPLSLTAPHRTSMPPEEASGWMTRRGLRPHESPRRTRPRSSLDWRSSRSKGPFPRLLAPPHDGTGRCHVDGLHLDPFASETRQAITWAAVTKAPGMMAPACFTIQAWWKSPRVLCPRRIVTDACRARDFLGDRARHPAHRNGDRSDGRLASCDACASFEKAQIIEALLSMQSVDGVGEYRRH